MRQFACVFNQRIDDGFAILSRQSHQHHVAGMTFNERCYLAAAAPTEQVSFPVPGDGPVLDICGRLADRHCSQYPAMIVSLLRVVARMPHGASSSQVLLQLLLERPVSLDKDSYRSSRATPDSPC